MFAPLALILAMALWASSFIALKLAFVEIPPMWVICLRMWIALAILACCWRWLGKAHYRKGDWKLLAAMSVAEPCLYFMLEAKALLYTSASQAGMITSMIPVLTAVGAYFAFKERLQGRALTGLAIALVGAVWLSLAGEADEHAPNPWLGNFLEFLAMLCATCYSLALKHLSSRYSALWLTALQALVGALFFLPLAWQAPLPEQISWPAMAAVFYLGAFVTLGAYGLYNYAISKVPLSRAAVFTNLIPVFTALMAMAVLGERLNAAQMAASVLVLGGVWLSQQKPTQQPAREPA
ncbi:DMT family transporter [Gallaecimonas sp. GXIMD4217]|uniref:DMT family transporter n=1 Tax=Gallaecimonas sp. GXIMD4217 TaxID=3131927 RepID=UPI00311ADEDC